MKTALEVTCSRRMKFLLEYSPPRWPMIERIYKENPTCVLGFSTNGKALERAEVYSRYSAAGIGYIQLSITRATKELYEAMRRAGSFDQLVANLEGMRPCVAARRRGTAPATLRL